MDVADGRGISTFTQDMTDPKDERTLKMKSPSAIILQEAGTFRDLKTADGKK